MKRYLLFLATALLLASCSKSEVISNDTQNQMRFTASVPIGEAEWGLATRGAVTGSDNIAEFGAFCFNTGRTLWATAAATALPDKMFDVEVRRTPSTNDWVYNPPVEWLAGDAALFTFFGYSPRAKGIYREPDNSQGNNIELVKSDADPGIPQLRYSTLDYVPMQIDLLVSKPVYDTRPVDKVQMQFAHALSQIRFKAWANKQGVRPESIAINGIKYIGQLDMDGENIVWTPQADVADFSIVGNFPVVSTDELNMTDLSSGGKAFMLLPQDMTANASAKIVITATIAGVEQSKEYTIKENWQAGKTYTYTVDLGGNPTEEIIITGVEITDWMIDSEEDMSTTPPPAPPAYIEVDGLKWAVGNLVANGANGAKIGGPEDRGLYFHFGSLVGWSDSADSDGTGVPTDAPATLCLKPAAYTGSPTWPAPFFTAGTEGEDYRLPSIDDPVTGIGDPCRFYLGGDWRTPTTEEWTSLLGGNLEQTNKNTPMIHAASNLTFPATGWYFMQIVDAQGAPNLFSLSSELHLWSSSINGQGVSLYPFSVIVAPGPGYYNTIHNVPIDTHFIAMPTRCVSGTYVKPLVHKPEPPTPDQIVEINGLKWTTGNLVARDALNCKVGAPEDGGLYFQFGSLLGWKGGATGDGTGRAAKADDSYYGGATFNAADEVAVVPATFSKISSIGTTWPNQLGNNLYYFGYNADKYSTSGTNIQDFEGVLNGALAPDGVGDPCRYYLGGEWRMPTNDEFQAMNDAATKSWTGSWSTGVSVDSYLVWAFAGGGELKFPAVGRRGVNLGSVSDVGVGHYWSSSIYSTTGGRHLRFLSNYVNPENAQSREYAFPVRCVSGTYTPPPPPPAGSYIPTAVLEAAGWPADKLPARGLQVAMRGDKQMPGSGTFGNDPAEQWKTTQTATAGVESVDGLVSAQFGMGKSSTDAMTATPELAALHPAAQYCRDMGSEWYLPSLKELRLIYDNNASLGSTYSIDGPYWSSTDDSSNSNVTWYISFYNGSPSTSLKTNTAFVRCVREI